MNPKMIERIRQAQADHALFLKQEEERIQQELEEQEIEFGKKRIADQANLLELLKDILTPELVEELQLAITNQDVRTIEGVAKNLNRDLVLAEDDWYTNGSYPIGLFQ